MFFGDVKPASGNSGSNAYESFHQGSGVVFPFSRSSNSGPHPEIEYVLLNFRPTEYGQYRVILETQQDNPTIRNEDFKLRVDTVYFGK
jgi:hypothetical protein